jgi:ABC-2 type transport system permease protein
MPLAVCDLDQTFFSSQVRDRLKSGDQFRLIPVDSEATIRRMLTTGEARLGIVIPKGFEANLVETRQTAFPLFVDGTMPTLAQAALYGASVLTGEDASASFTFVDPDKPAPTPPKPPIKIAQRILFNPTLRDSTFFLPGTIGIVIMLVVLTLSSGLVREKEQATIEQLLVTPISRFALIAGKMIPYGIVALFDFAVVSILAKVIFEMPFSGAVLPVTLLAILFILALLALGALISTVSQTQLQANFMAVFVIVPSVLLSGFVFPLEAIPQWLRPVAWGLPMTYFVDAIRGLTLKGASVVDLAHDFIVLAAFMVGFTLLSLARFRKQLA